MAPTRLGPATKCAEVFGLCPKFAAAAVAAIIAIFVLILGVEIDPTIETLILALSPVIVGYLWPNPGNVNRLTSDWVIDRNVALALGAALIVYIIAQTVLLATGTAELAITDTAYNSEAQHSLVAGEQRLWWP